MNLKLLGRMIIDIINIIEHDPCENKSIIMIKNNQPPKGGLVRRRLRDK